MDPNSTAGAPPSAGALKALDRIKAQLDAGAHYEAQQMYKTTYARYRSRRQPGDAYAVLAAGAAQQLAAGQGACGAELATMLVDAYTEDKVPASGAPLDALCDVVRAMRTPDASASASSSAAAAAVAGGGPSGDSAESAVAACARCVAAAVKWAHKQGADSAVATLHDLFASALTEAYGWRQLGRAAAHYARGADADAFAAAVATAAARAPENEADLFVARAVLQTLACAHPSTAARRLSHARAVLEAAQRQQRWQASARQPPAGAPLMHFCELLLTALEKRSRPLVALLREKYAPSLARDPALGAYLARAEEVYLGAPPGAGGGLLAGLLRGLLEGDEEDE